MPDRKDSDFIKNKIQTLDEDIQNAEAILSQLNQNPEESDQFEKNVRLLNAKVSSWKQKRDTLLKLYLATLKRN